MRRTSSASPTGPARAQTARCVGRARERDQTPEGELAARRGHPPRSAWCTCAVQPAAFFTGLPIRARRVSASSPTAALRHPAPQRLARFTPASLLRFLPRSGPMSATAWYALGGGGNGPGRDELETDAFLVDEGTFVEPMPIASVTPADAWDHSDVNEFVITDTEASDVQALNTVGGHSNELFERWYALEGNAAPTLGHGLPYPSTTPGSRSRPTGSRPPSGRVGSASVRRSQAPSWEVSRTTAAAASSSTASSTRSGHGTRCWQDWRPSRPRGVSNATRPSRSSSRHYAP